MPRADVIPMRRTNPALRIGILSDGMEERRHGDRVELANGGVGVYIYNLVKHLRATDDVNEYYLLHRYGGALDVYEGHDVYLPPRFPYDHTELFDWPYRAVVRRLGLDVLHYPSQWGGGFLPRRIKRVITVHDLTTFRLPGSHPRLRVLSERVFLHQALRKADRVIAVSQHTRADLLARAGVDAARVSVISHGIGEHFRPGVHTVDFTRRYELPERFILTVGVLEPRKNHATLLAALAELHARGERISLVIVGREGWKWVNPLDDPRLCHLRPWVHVCRNVADSDLPEFYNRAAAFAFPSLYEGFGLPVLEAMACGTPVVTSCTSSLPEVAGAAALLVDPLDSAALAGQLRVILTDRSRRDRLIAEGLRRAQQFSWHRTAQQTRAVYEHVCRSEV